MKLTRVQRKRMRRRRFIRTLIYLVLIGISIYLLFNLDIFRIKEVSVKGNQVLDESIIRDLSGIGLGENIFKEVLTYSKKDLLNNPYIKRVKLSPKLPNKLILEVSERESYAYLILEKSYYLIDNNGYILEALDEIEGNYPLINYPNVIISEGQVFKEYEDQDTVDFLRSIGDLLIKEDILKIDISDKEDIIIDLSGDRLIYFGPSYNWQYKFKLLDEVTSYLKTENLKFTSIFLNKGEDPIVWLEEEEEDNEV